jgi:hypothetical protein
MSTNVRPDTSAPVWQWQPPSGEPRKRPPQGSGAGFALGLMPPVMILIQYVVAVVLAKAVDSAAIHAGPHASPFSGLATGALAGLLYLGLLVGGVGVVYFITQSAGLALGYLVVYWVESYVFSLVVTTSMLAAFGLHNELSKLPHASSPAAVSPRPAAGPAITADNSQGIKLTIEGQTVSVALPAEVDAAGKNVSLLGSTAGLTCEQGGAGAIKLPSSPYRNGGYDWTLPAKHGSLTQCSGRITIAQGGLNVNSPGISGLALEAWNLVGR